MRGQGKTNFVKGFVSDAMPLFITDIRNEYSHIKPFYDLRQFNTYTYNRTYILNKTGNKEQWRFAFNTMPEYIKIISYMNYFQRCTIVIDEADSLFQIHKLEEPLMNLLLGSRNNKVDLIFNTKRPFLVPIAVRSQCDEYYIFRTKEQRDITYLQDRLKASFPKEPDKLERGECIHLVDDAEPELLKIPLFTGDKQQ